MSKNHQFITSQPQGKDLVFGAKRRLGGLPINQGGQWDAFLPIGDPPQNLGFSDPECCASAGTLHAIEMLLAKKGITELLSYRFLAKVSGTTTGGNDPHLVAESLRTGGIVDFKDYPYTADMNTWEKFYADIANNLISLARIFKATYMFGHEYVAGDAISMKAALEFSPLGVAVWAWDAPDMDGLYRRSQPYDDHWVVIYGYEEGKFWKCFDSYDKSTKKLSWNFGFRIVKRYTLEKNVVDERWQAFFVNFFRNMRASLGFLNAMGFKLGLVGARLPSLGELAWGDPVAARHSARVVMDAFNLSWKEKGLLCSVLAEESGFKNTAKNENFKMVPTGELDKDGKKILKRVVTSIDWGLIQCNDYWNIGEDKPFPSVEYLLAHPEEQIAFMVKMYRAGQLDMWCAYSSGAYKKWLPDGLIK